MLSLILSGHSNSATVSQIWQFHCFPWSFPPGASVSLFPSLCCLPRIVAAEPGYSAVSLPFPALLTLPFVLFWVDPCFLNLVSSTFLIYTPLPDEVHPLVNPENECTGEELLDSSCLIMLSPLHLIDIWPNKASYAENHFHRILKASHSWLTVSSIAVVKSNTVLIPDPS